jgi:hypothetical protein
MKAGPIADIARLEDGRARKHSRPGYGLDNSDCQVDADYVVYRLEEAGATLLALPGTGWTTRLRSSSIEIVRTALEAYGWEATRIHPAVPAADKIDRMDEAMAWIALIPRDRYVLRRVVGARSLWFIRSLTAIFTRGGAWELPWAPITKACNGGMHRASR